MTGPPGAGVVVHVVTGVPRPLWCDDCATSAGVVVTVYALAGAVGPYPVGVVSYCTRCDDLADVTEHIRRDVAKGLGIDPTP